MAPYQERAVFNGARWAITEASTKSGKTAACLVWLAEQAMAGRAGQNFWWIAPVYPQSKIAYTRMKRGIPRQFYRSNETDLWIELANGARIWFKSGEKPDNLYGEDVYAAVIDEASRLREEAWHAVRSTLTATRGPARIIGNVKGRANWFYRMARDAERSGVGMSYAKIQASDAVEAGILEAAEIEDAKARLPSHVYRELYEAHPADLQGRVYVNFEYARNVSSDAKDNGSAVLVGMDFNVNPMSAVLCSRAGDQLHVFDEILIRDSNTDEMAKAIRHRVGSRPVRVYPDPSGNSRKTSAPVGATDFSILRSHGFMIVADKQAPPVVDRYNEVNALCMTTDGKTRLYVNPSCENLIDALENLIYKEGTSLADKAGGYDHVTDALGYLVHQEFPLVPPMIAAQEPIYAVLGA